MNYYERHLGDYAKNCSHLSLLEHGVYVRLLDVYYTREEPIPEDRAARLIGARNEPETQALQVVLQEFFELRDGHWHQDRADQEIAAYVEGEPEREIKKANEDNRLKRHRQERADLFKILTDRGEHAPWNIGITELRERVAGVAAPGPETTTATQPATATATPATATQSPDTNPQTPDTSPSLRSGEVGAGKPRTSRPKKEETTLATYLANCKEAGVKPLPADHAIRDYCRDAGISEEMVQVAWCVFRDEYTKGTKQAKKYKDWPGHFANAVRKGWLKLWYMDTAAGCMAWTSLGNTEKAVLDARRNRENEHVA